MTMMTGDGTQRLRSYIRSHALARRADEQRRLVDGRSVMPAIATSGAAMLKSSEASRQTDDVTGDMRPRSASYPDTDRIERHRENRNLAQQGNDAGWD